MILRSERNCIVSASNSWWIIRLYTAIARNWLPMRSAMDNIVRGAQTNCCFTLSLQLVWVFACIQPAIVKDVHWPLQLPSIHGKSLLQSWIAPVYLRNICVSLHVPNLCIQNYFQGSPTRNGLIRLESRCASFSRINSNGEREKNCGKNCGSLHNSQSRSRIHI